MKKCKRYILLPLLLVCLHLLPGTAVKVRAVDPATMTAAAPQALALAALWSPHVANTMSSTGIGMVNIGKSFIKIFCLPWGLIQCTAGAPFGYLDSGINNCASGIVAPFELAVEILLLPVRIISLGTVK